MKYFFFRNRILIVSRACKSRFLITVVQFGRDIIILAECAQTSFLRWLCQRWNGFFPLLLSQRWISVRVLFIFNDGFKICCNFPLISCWPSMSKNWLLVSWACAKLHGYSLAEHAQKLVTCWLSIRENHFGATQNFQRSVFCVLFPLSPVPLSPSPIPCLMSLVLYTLSYVSVICLPSAVPSLTSACFVSCLTSLFLVSRLKWSVPSPILPVPQCPSVPLSVALFHCSYPLLLCFPSSFPSSLVLCPLREWEYFLLGYSTCIHLLQSALRWLAVRAARCT